MQYLEFGGPDAEFGIKFTRDENDGQIVDVWYVCRHCQGRIDEWKKTEMLSKGKYIHKYPGRKKRGFRINSQYSPIGWLSWLQIAEEFVKAAKALKGGDPKRMKKWVNTRQAESWEEDGEQPEHWRLSARAEPYKILTAPDGVGMITAGVDTQDNRLEVVVMGWGRGEESWVIYKSALYGDPDQHAVWQQLDELLFRTITHASGAELHIESVGIDTGGHKTQSVYNYCRSRAPVVFALKGSSLFGKPVVGTPTRQDVAFNGKKLKHGVALYLIGTDIAKGTIYNRLKIDVPGPGYTHFPIGLDDEFYKQLTAEKLVTSHNKRGFAVKNWVKTRERNDVLDCVVYAYASAIKAGLSRRNWDITAKNLLKQAEHTNTDSDVQQTNSPAHRYARSPLSGRNINPHKK